MSIHNVGNCKAGLLETLAVVPNLYAHSCHVVPVVVDENVPYPILRCMYSRKVSVVRSRQSPTGRVFVSIYAITYTDSFTGYSNA